MGLAAGKDKFVFVVALAILAIATACGTAQSDGLPAPSTVPITEAKFPLYTLSDSTDLGRFESLLGNYLVQECMTAQGFEYPTEVFILPHSEQPREFQTSLRGAGDEDWDARGIGYRRHDSEPDPQLESGKEWFQTLPTGELDAWNHALFGQEERTYEVDGQVAGGYNADGCLAEASLVMWGTFDSRDDDLILQTAIFNVAYESEQRVEADPRYLQALGSWQSCMEEEGVGFESPDTALEYVIEHYWFPDQQDPDAAPPVVSEAGEVELLPLTSEEVDIAVADKNCRAESRLYVVFNEVLNGYQEAYVDSPEGQALVLNTQERNRKALDRFTSQLERFGG